MMMMMMRCWNDEMIRSPWWPLRLGILREKLYFYFGKLSNKKLILAANFGDTSFHYPLVLEQLSGTLGCNPSCCMVQESQNWNEPMLQFSFWSPDFLFSFILTFHTLIAPVEAFRKFPLVESLQPFQSLVVLRLFDNREAVILLSAWIRIYSIYSSSSNWVPSSLP